ncbi:disease resistance protein RGA2-like [Nicotiana sylvestris]|uniref:disease resistance protein RGA2-like n=1 Tax=Nicotiana sylvestris TaxID=4096 RepID=UPI00388C63BA
MIQAFIHDAERRQVEDQAVEQWLKRLERVAEDAENVFDEFKYESLKAKVMKIRKNPIRKASGFFSHTAFKSKMSQKIKNINEELWTINQLANTLIARLAKPQKSAYFEKCFFLKLLFSKAISLQPLRGPSQQILPIREIDSVVVASDVVGRDKDVAEIKEKMLNMREDVVLCTIPIVGMGGSGKTTVAKRIFNDEHIKQQFEKRVWLCLPEMLEAKSFLELMLESLTERKPEVQSRDIIVKKIRDELRGKRYLLVLDDLWRVDSWHDFVDTLRGINTSRGNCILVTTRSKKMESSITVDLHKLEVLADDHCWSVFKQRAFVDAMVPEELVSMGNRIVEMCKGKPGALSSRYAGDPGKDRTTRVYSTQPYPAFLQEVISTA